MTADELKSVISEAISEDLDAIRETIEIQSNKKIMKQIRKADEDWESGKKGAYVLWNDIK